MKDTSLRNAKSVKRKPTTAEIRAYAASRQSELLASAGRQVPQRTLKVNSNYERQAPPVLAVEKQPVRVEKLMNSHQIGKAREVSRNRRQVRAFANHRAGIHLE